MQRREEKRFLLIKSMKKERNVIWRKKTINKKFSLQKKRQFMQGDLFKEGQRLTLVFERKKRLGEKKTNNNFYWSYCCKLYARFSVPHALDSFCVCIALHRSSSSPFTVSQLKSCPFVRSFCIVMFTAIYMVISTGANSFQQNNIYA